MVVRARWVERDVAIVGRCGWRIGNDVARSVRYIGAALRRAGRTARAAFAAARARVAAFAAAAGRAAATCGAAVAAAIATDDSNG
jgi:hypothetical protein